MDHENRNTLILLISLYYNIHFWSEDTPCSESADPRRVETVRAKRANSGNNQISVSSSICINLNLNLNKHQ